MPKAKKSQLFRSTSNARRLKQARNLESVSQREARLLDSRLRISRSRVSESNIEREERLEQNRLHISQVRVYQTSAEREMHLERRRLRYTMARVAETSPEREERLKRRRCQVNHTGNAFNSFIEPRSAFCYQSSNDYLGHSDFFMGKMEKVCNYCYAKKWSTESLGLCCSNGHVQLNDIDEPLGTLKELLIGTDPRSKHFQKNIRKYNGCFAMTSFGGKEVREGNYMPTYKVHGQIYHLIGSLLPPSDTRAQFLQIYFTSEDEQLNLRHDSAPSLKKEILKTLQQILRDNNSYVRSFITAIEQMPLNKDNYKIVIHAEQRPLGEHRGRYNAPTTNEVAVLMVDEDCGFRDIVLRSRDNTFQRISELHRSYDPMQYPLIFIRGENGYNISIPQIVPTTGQDNPRKMVSCMQFYAYKLMVRENSFNTLHRYSQLFNQYCVDMAAKMITERLNFIRAHQKKLRAENYIHLRDAVNEDSNVADIGQLVILPFTFTGSPRYLHERTQDALTYVRNYGRPDLFITFTCNPEWPEIKTELYPGQRPSERHDIVARVFHLKVQQLMKTITKKDIFGQVRCHMFSIEWQKRGLPHAHILIWLVDKIRSDEIDSIISAEIPNKDEDPLLYDIVCKNMIHGPCGAVNSSLPCMSNGTCSKRYPRDFLQYTQTGDDGYPKYRRRCPADGGNIYTISHCNYIVDNKWVVPYCPILSRCFVAHVNVEYCHSVQAIKYICKYINKGNDAATFTVENKRDEVQNYLNGRYLSTSESIWRILGFSIHERYPTVVHLSVHLENGQRVYFTERNLQQVIENPPQTTLTAFFALCVVDKFAQTLLYHEVPTYYKWSNKKWQRRKRGQDVDGYPGIKRDTVLGRVYTIHPNYLECFYLRLLLHHVRGPTSFNDLKTVNGEIMPTYRAACQARNLLENDTHWRDTLSDAAISESAHKMRELFSIMLMFCEMSNPLELWNAYRTHLCDNILHRVRQQSNNSEVQFTEEIFNEGSILLEDIVFTHGEKCLKEFSLPEPQRNNSNIDNLLYLRETVHNIDDLQVYLQENEVKLNTEQKMVYDEIINSVEDNKGNIYFIDAPGGTGKTFIISLILAKVRSQKKIAIAVASSGIAATLLSGGRTAHSTFKLPLNVSLDQSSVCSVRKNGVTGKLLQQASLIVWDECTMSHKSHIDAVNRTLKDLRTSEKVMGGVTFVFTGDFRQTLPVVPKGTRADIMKVCIKKSEIWQHVKKLRLTINMRIHLRGDKNLEQFAQYLLKIGDGSITQNGYINISDIVGNCVRTIDQIIDNVYPDIQNLTQKKANWLCERAIITAKNKAAEEINKTVLQKVTTECKTYKSIDTMVNGDEVIHYPIEFLNSLNPAGLPPHELRLKVGTPIMLLRNLKPP